VMMVTDVCDQVADTPLAKECVVETRISGNGRLNLFCPVPIEHKSAIGSILMQLLCQFFKAGNESGAICAPLITIRATLHQLYGEFVDFGKNLDLFDVVELFGARFLSGALDGNEGNEHILTRRVQLRLAGSGLLLFVLRKGQHCG
jgi:hypothetical protein